jgi:hypothetical protein
MGIRRESAAPWLLEIAAIVDRRQCRIAEQENDAATIVRQQTSDPAGWTESVIRCAVQATPRGSFSRLDVSPPARLAPKLSR